MRFIVHIGMHKTGSSSIQETFSRLDLPGFAYMPGPANHSAWFAEQFGDTQIVASTAGQAAVGRGKTEIEARRKAGFEAFDRWVDERRPQTVLISAESISSRSTDNRLEAFRSWLERYSNDISVVGYVRPPVAYLQSHLQQQMKISPVRGIMGSASVLRYRERFAPFDMVFGRNNVKFKLFAPDRFPDGDVVADFAREIGIELPKGTVQRVNESMSLEAAALLYVQALYGDGIDGGYPGALVDRNRFVALISALGRTPIRFGRGLADDLRRLYSESIRWMEARLGESLEETQAGGRTIDGGDDLIAAAIEAAPLLRDLASRQGVEITLPPQSGPEVVAAAMDAIRATVTSPAVMQKRFVVRAAPVTSYRSILLLSFMDALLEPIAGLLAQRRGALRRMGLDYARGSFAPDRHAEIAVAILRPECLMPFRALQSNTESERRPDEVMADLADRCAPSEVATTIFWAAEAQHVRTEAEAQALKTVVPGPVQAVVVVPDRAALVARHRQRMAAWRPEGLVSGDGMDSYWDTRDGSWVYDMDSGLRALRAAFGYDLTEINVAKMDMSQDKIRDAVLAAIGLTLGKT